MTAREKKMESAKKEEMANGEPAPAPPAIFDNQRWTVEAYDDQGITVQARYAWELRLLQLIRPRFFGM
jgi:hypothetical protein